MKLLIAAAIAFLIGSVEAVHLPRKTAAVKAVGNGFVEILGAAYGPADVTEKVRSLFDGGVKVIQAENAVFGDSWPGIVKSLHISYRHCEDSKTVTVKEGGAIAVPEGSEIHGAAYGSIDVTRLLRQKYAAGERNFGGNNGVWGDPWPGMPKTFSISFRTCQADKTVVVREHASITLP